MAGFEDKLVLSRWMLKQFGATRFETLSDGLSDDHLIGFDVDNCSKYVHELIAWIPEVSRTVTNDQLLYYDDNIVRYWKQITKKRNHGGSPLFPLYFQYLSLLVTEHYLDRYFTDRSMLCDDLNRFLKQFNQDFLKYEQIGHFKETDLNKLALWVATGGGKTLIMHVNMLQFGHYLKKTRRDGDFNQTILLTPNEGLSLQHKDELDLSDIEADLFVKDGGNLFSGVAVKIIDIHKLREKSGEKTIAVESFESNNLVLVDEGHRGASGVDWMDKRNQLCEKGFSFEYSATFGQAIKAASDTHLASTGRRVSNAKHCLKQQYSRCILFDYSYKFFHGDGYGKDHYILNLSKSQFEEHIQLYLTGGLLTFYQQKCIYENGRKELAQYLLADPLWIFVGGKVIARNKNHQKTLSDVQAILRFISRFIRNKGGESVRFLELLLNNQDGLYDEDGRTIFGKTFPFLQNRWATDQAEALFQDVLRTIFHANAIGSLHVVHLKGNGGEIGLRVGLNAYFGLINVGDATKLIKLCKGNDDDNMVITDQALSSSLFKEINRKDSSINLLLGAKKFTEGWNSWRVSTMGLMNVGRSEGSEIIQLFGRGVRLKGYGFSLKRSNQVRRIEHPENIALLETLNVFGIRSDYMKQFKAYLDAEGVEEGTTEIVMLPVTKQLTRNDLKFVRARQDLKPFKQSGRPSLGTPPSEMKGKVTLNWYPKIQATRSTDVSVAVADNLLNEGHLDGLHLSFLNFEEIYFELVQYKNEKAWYNLKLYKQNIRDILKKPSWYRLYIPQNMLEARGFERILIWQEIAIALLKKYVGRYYFFRKNEYERPHLEYYEVRESDDNFIKEYRATIDSREKEWMSKLNELKNKLSDKSFRASWSFGNLKAFDFSQHLYRPLFYFSNSEVLKISPVALNRGEYDFVSDLEEFYCKSTKFFDDKELFLLRNQSRGKGIGFFEEGDFYPDFILWLIQGDKQYVCFVDPKGLTYVHGFCDSKIQFHKTIKKTQKKLGDPNVFLDSFIISNTFRADVNWWKEGGASKQDFAKNHILFQKDEKNSYISNLLNSLISQDASG